MHLTNLLHASFLPLLVTSSTTHRPHNALFPKQHDKLMTRSNSTSCPPGFKDVTFNGGYNPSQFTKITGAANWITFGMGSSPGQLPMMAFASDVSAAVSLLSSSSSPPYLLTVNEPEYAYDGNSLTMSPQQAADAIKPPLALPTSNP